MDASLYPPNAILFVFDLSNKSVEVPEYIDDVLTAGNKSCVSIGTQADVDGEVLVKLQNPVSSPEKGKYQLVFQGTIDTPGKKIAVVTAEFDKVLEKDVRGRKTDTSIWVDDLNHPSMILVEAD